MKMGSKTELKIERKNKDRRKTKKERTTTRKKRGMKKELFASNGNTQEKTGGRN
jgi:hypothetical protein